MLCFGYSEARDSLEESGILKLVLNELEIVNVNDVVSRLVWDWPTTCLSKSVHAVSE